MLPEQPAVISQLSESSPSPLAAPLSSSIDPTDTMAAWPQRAGGIADIAAGRDHCSCPLTAEYALNAHRSSIFSPLALTPPKM